MNINLLLPFIVLKYDNKKTECLSTLTDDYAEQFDDVKYTYPTGSELMGKRSRYTGGVSWIYTKMLPQVFGLYEGGKT